MLFAVSCGQSDLKNGFGLKQKKSQAVPESTPELSPEIFKSKGVGVADMNFYLEIYSRGCGITSNDIQNVYNETNPTMPSTADTTVFNGAKANLLLGTKCCYEKHFNNDYSDTTRTKLTSWGIDAQEQDSTALTLSQLDQIVEFNIKTFWGYDYDYSAEKQLMIEFANNEKGADLSNMEISFMMCSLSAASYPTILVKL